MINIKGKEMPSLWSHKDLRLKVDERKRRVREEYFRNKLMFKTLSKQVKRL